MKLSNILFFVAMLLLQFHSGKAVGQYAKSSGKSNVSAYWLDISTFQMDGQFISFRSNEKFEVEKDYDTTLLFGDEENPEETRLGLSVHVKNIKKNRDEIDFELQFGVREIFGWRTFSEAGNAVIRIPLFAYSGAELHMTCKVGEWCAVELNGYGVNNNQTVAVQNQLSSSGIAPNMVDATNVIPCLTEPAIIFLRIRPVLEQRRQISEEEQTKATKGTGPNAAKGTRRQRGQTPEGNGNACR